MLTRLVNFNKVAKLTQMPNAGYNLYAKAFQGLDPAKHIYMNHSMQNQYDDLFQLGDYPYVNDFAQMVDSHEYVPQFLNVIEEHLRERYPNNTFNIQKYIETNEAFANWEDLGVDNFNSEVPAILTKLAERVVIKDSKLTWTKEQRLRYETSHKSFVAINFKETAPFHFVECYNFLVWMMVRRSHLWSAPHIVGSKSPLEAQIERDAGEQPKVESLHKDRPENKNIINAFMRFVHG